MTEGVSPCTRCGRTHSQTWNGTQQQYCYECWWKDASLRIATKKATKKQKTQKGYVYLVHCETTDFYKIGRSTAPSYRIQELQVANPYELVLVWTKKSPDAPALEYHLQTHHWNNRIRGEWFRLSREEVWKIDWEATQWIRGYKQRLKNPPPSPEITLEKAVGKLYAYYQQHPEEYEKLNQ